MDVLADTVFFIDLQRSRPEPLAWLANNPGSQIAISAVTYAEFLVGQPDETVLQRLLGKGPRLIVDYDVAREYGRVARFLRSQGRMIGANDLWIASVALVNGLPVLTRNVGEFSRVPELQVVGY